MVSTLATPHHDGTGNDSREKTCPRRSPLAGGNGCLDILFRDAQSLAVTQRSGNRGKNFRLELGATRDSTALLSCDASVPAAARYSHSAGAECVHRDLREFDPGSDGSLGGFAAARSHGRTAAAREEPFFVAFNSQRMGP